MQVLSSWLVNNISSLLLYKEKKCFFICGLPGGHYESWPVFSSKYKLFTGLEDLSRKISGWVMADVKRCFMGACINVFRRSKTYFTLLTRIRAPPTYYFMNKNLTFLSLDFKLRSWKDWSKFTGYKTIIKSTITNEEHFYSFYWSLQKFICRIHLLLSLTE